MEHVQFGVVLDENVSLAGLKKFPVVCLANVAILSSREVALLTDYVKQGGKLLITGHTGQFNAMGAPLPDTTLADLIGANVVRRLDSEDNWVRVDASLDNSEPAATLSSQLRPDWQFLVKGPATVYQPTTAQSFGNCTPPIALRVSRKAGWAPSGR